jgi:Tfp pilus assembly protein PilO
MAVKHSWRQLGERERLIGLSLLALVGLMLLVRVAYAPWARAIEQRRARLAELRAQVAAAESMIARLPQEQAGLEEARRRAQALERRVSAQLSLPRVLDALSAQAQEQQVELVVIQPRDTESGETVVSLGPDLRLRPRTLTLQLGGTYQHIGEFLGRLATAPFLASVRSVTLSRSQQPGTSLTAEVALRVHLPEEAAGS